MDEASEELVAELTKKQKKNLEKKRRQKEEQVVEQKKAGAEKLKKTALASLALVAGAFLVYFVAMAPKVEGPYTPGPVHWHSTLSMTACGQPIPLPRAPPGRMLGPEIRHLHDNDDKIHIEAQVQRKEDIMVEAFLADICVAFNEKQLGNYGEGNQCPNGKAGKVAFTVNGKPSTEYEKYVMQDGDKIEIRFE